MHIVLAEPLGISESTLSHLFSASLHVSLPRYLTLLRLEEAQHLLTEKHLSVTAVASASGFSSLRTMNRAFREHLGKSPSQYQRETPLNTHFIHSKENDYDDF